MSNTKSDLYIDSLKPGDMVLHEGGLRAIVDIGTENAYLNMEGEIEKVSLSDISETYELMVLEDV